MIFWSLRTIFLVSTCNNVRLRENTLRSELYVVALYVEWISKNPLLMQQVTSFGVCICMQVFCVPFTLCPCVVCHRPTVSGVRGCT